jgi:hypothetical protein
MDNFVLQGIEIYNTPEKTVSYMGEESFDGLYVVMDGGKTLQLDNYTLSYNPHISGVQTATVSYMGKSAGFDIMLLNAGDHIIDFGSLSLVNGTLALAAVYDNNGKMIKLESVILMGGKAQIVVSDNIYRSMKCAKLFVMSCDTFVPVAEVVISELS